MEVEILSRKLVKPSSPTPQELRRYKISSMDQLAVPDYVALILYYHPTRDDATLGDMQMKLEESLSRVLQAYYPLAGRYFEDNFTVDCNDEGVELVEAKVSCKLSQVLDRDFSTNELNKLVSCRMESETSPLSVVQFNMFECGGVAIGTCSTHRIVDASTWSCFINEWAQACRGLSMEVGYKVHRPDFHLPSIFQAKEGLPDDQARPIHKRRSSEFVSKRFVFSGEAIDNLKAMASANAPVGSRFSRVEVVTALIWKALIKATTQARNGGKFRPSLVTHPMNLRQKAGLPIPKNAFGNAIISAVPKFVHCGGGVEFPELVHLIHNAFTSTLKSLSELTNADDLYYKVTQTWKEVNQLYGKYDVFRFTSWCSVPFYETDFGWGKPTWVSGIRRPVEITTLCDTKDGKGVEAWLSFDQNLMVLLQKDTDLVAFTS